MCSAITAPLVPLSHQDNPISWKHISPFQSSAGEGEARGSGDDLLHCQRAAGGVPCTSGKGSVGFWTASAGEHTAPSPCSPLHPGAPLWAGHSRAALPAGGPCWCGASGTSAPDGTGEQVSSCMERGQPASAVLRIPPGARSVCLHGTGKINRDGSAALLKREATRPQHSTACLPMGCRALGHAPRGPDLQGQCVGSPKAGSVLDRCVADAAARALPGDRWAWLFISCSERARRGEGCNCKTTTGCRGWQGPAWCREPGSKAWLGQERREELVAAGLWQGRRVTLATKVLLLLEYTNSCLFFAYFCLLDLFIRLFMPQSQRVSSAPTGTRAQPRAAAGGPALGEVPCTIRQDKTGKCALAPCMTAT